MKNIHKKNIATKCVQGTYRAKNTEPMVMPIVQSTTYRYEQCDELANAFNLGQASHIYSRLSNPTLSVLEEKIALLEKGVAAVTTSSGQAATFYSVINITSAGENIVALSNVYGGTHTLLSKTLSKMGIETRFVAPDATAEEISAKIDGKTKLIFGETIGNPGLDVLDFAKISQVAQQAKIPFIVDNTFATPYLCNPLDHGANIVIHSMSKYLDGHATSLGGVIVDGGNFNWYVGGFEGLTTPDESYHGLVYAEAFGTAAYAAKIRAGLLRDLGATLAPFNAFLTNLGIETLHLRMQAHSENALKVAQYLAQHPKVEWVNYPLLEGNKNLELAKKYLPNGASGVVSFGIKGGINQAKKFIDNMELAQLVTHVGDLRTFALHPASTTHRQLSEAELLSIGIAPNMIRYNVGIENIDDILKDIEEAFAKV